MHTSLSLKEKVARFNADKEIQTLLAEINTDDGTMDPYFGEFTAEKANALKQQEFDRKALQRD